MTYNQIPPGVANMCRQRRDYEFAIALNASVLVATLLNHALAQQFLESQAGTSRGVLRVNFFGGAYLVEGIAAGALARMRG
jgi:hypothetical protein